MKRSLGLWSLVAAVYFCVSGGAFGLEPVIQLGPGLAVLLILLTPIIWSLPAALMTAELSSAIPEEGGYYVWVKRAIGQPWGFLCGWWSWVYSWVDVAIYPTLFAVYLAKFVELTGFAPAFDANPWLKWLIGLTMIVPMTWLNLRGTKLVGESSVTFMLVLLAPFLVLLVLGASGVFAHPQQTVHPFISPGEGSSGAFGVGLFAAMWNYLGWDSMSTVGGEVKDPQKTFTRAMAIGIPLVAITYLLPVLVGVTVLRDPSQWETGSWVKIGAMVGGKGLGIAMAAAGMISSAGQFGAVLLSGSRIPFVFAEGGYLPKALTRLHPRYGTPWAAVLVSAVFYTALSYETFKDLAVVDVVTYSSALLLELIALAVLRAKEPDLIRPYRIPGGWPVIALVVLCPTALIVFAAYSRYQANGKVAIVASVIALASGPVVWFIAARVGPRRVAGTRH